MKERQYDCIVIGGGAAGMMAAILSARKQLRTAIIEHTARVGSKLLQTGNGKCNFTNLNMSENMYQNEDKAFVKNVLEQFGVKDTLEFFQGIGIYHRDRNGYVYPNSETAASLQDAMRLEVEHLGIDVYLECHLNQIRMEKNSLYQIETDKGLFCAQALVVATGSKAAPKTGSDGSGYEIARQLGHHIRKPLPALVQLISQDKCCKPMAGVRATGCIELIVDGSMMTSDLGEIQYTEYGVSGIPVFQISRYAVQAIDKRKEVSVLIDMLPDFNLDMLYSEIERRYTYDNQKTVEQFLSGMLNKKLVHGICKRIGMNHNDMVLNIKLKELKRICNTMKQFQLQLNDYKPFEQAQICQGGVSLKEIDSSDMQSKLRPGLFFAGEVTDVDGKCGGYNLQWAWSSAAVAAEGVSAYVKRKEQ